MLLTALITLSVLVPVQHAHPQSGMPFDQDAVVHHFTIERAGGTIAVTVKPNAPDATLTAVRGHLREIATAFGRGDFSASIATHAEIPAGVKQMTDLKDRIRYQYVETKDGGRVTIRTTDSAALDAVHTFLRYQIKEHKTGDPMRLQ